MSPRRFLCFPYLWEHGSRAGEKAVLARADNRRQRASWQGRGPKTAGPSLAKLEMESLTLALVAHTFVAVKRRTLCVDERVRLPPGRRNELRGEPLILTHTGGTMLDHAPESETIVLESSSAFGRVRARQLLSRCAAPPTLLQLFTSFYLDFTPKISRFDNVTA